MPKYTCENLIGKKKVFVKNIELIDRKKELDCTLLDYFKWYNGTLGWI